MGTQVKSPATAPPPAWLLEVHAVLADQPFPIAALAAQARVNPVVWAAESARREIR